MLLFKKHKLIINLKKISRIKFKYNLVTKIRRKNKYTFFAKKNHEHRSVANVLNRKFKGHKADEVYSTDITQFNLTSGNKGYLAVFKDLGTKEIKSFTMSRQPSVYFVNQALSKALLRLPTEKKAKLVIHSDQGFHFTHFGFRKKIQEFGAIQSMSRRGNCLDNAPVESFFGYLKDHIDLKTCNSFEELEKAVTKEIHYYNNDRPQWDLNKMPPTIYRRHIQ